MGDESGGLEEKDNKRDLAATRKTHANILLRATERNQPQVNTALTTTAYLGMRTDKNGSTENRVEDRLPPTHPRPNKCFGACMSPKCMAECCVYINGSEMAPDLYRTISTMEECSERYQSGA
jgi:hypothetical protein